MSGQRPARSGVPRHSAHPSANPPPRGRFDGLKPFEYDYPQRDVSYSQMNTNVDQEIIIGGKLFRSVFHPGVINAITAAVNKHPLVQKTGTRDPEYIALKIRRFGPENLAILNKLAPEQKASWIAANLIRLFSQPVTVENSTPAYDMDQIAIETMKTNIRRDAPPPVAQEIPVQPPSEPSAPALVPTHSAAVLGFMNPHALSAALWSGQVGRRTYILLDSLNRKKSDDTNLGEYRWQISADQNRLQDGMAMPSVLPRTIRAMRIVNMSIPNLENAQGNLGEVSIQLKEIVSQGYNSSNYIEHFVGTAVPNGDRIEVDFSARTGKIIFNHPITSLEAITLIMRNPTDVINYGWDSVSVSGAVILGTTTLFSYIEIFTGTFANTNDLIQIIGFSSTNAADGVIVKEANRNSGHVVVSTSSTNIELDFDTTVMTGTVDNSSQITLANLTKRILFRLELEHVEIADGSNQ